MDIYNESNIGDKFFGIGFVNRDSVNDKDIEKLIEIDPLDIFFHYGIIGFILLAYVTVMLFAYPTLINDTFDFWFTFTLIAAMSISQLGQYFVGISYQLLLNSDQRSYVQLVVNGATLVLNTLFSVILMICGASIQVVKLITALIYIMRPLALYLYVKKHYAIDKKNKADGIFFRQPYSFLMKEQLFSSLYRHLSKILHCLHKVKSSLTSTCSSSLISFFNLSVSVLYEYFILCLDLIYKLFHVV
jgi:hypothetical protein